MDSIIYDKCLEFSLMIIQIYKELELNKEFILSKQLLRSATSVGANVAEAKFAQSTKDFISKMHIALKEANETVYWLELLSRAEYIEVDTYNCLMNNCIGIRKMLIKIVKNTKLSIEA